MDLSSIVEQIRHVDPHVRDFVLGSLFGAVLTVAIARVVGLGGLSRANREWERIGEAREKEIKALKQEMREKDTRIDRCHDRIRSLEATAADSAGKE